MRQQCLICGSALVLWVAPASGYAASVIGDDCTFKGFALHGKVQIVESFPDIKVKIVDSYPDLKVRVVTSFADKCGMWTFVESFPDIKIQYVDSFPDLKIQMVTSYPGLP
jgi:hypothetical protein